MNQDIKTFKEGLDSDTEDRFLPESRYRHAKNALSGVSSESNVGSLESVQSNALRHLVLGYPNFTDTFINNDNDWSINENIGSSVIVTPIATSLASPNMTFPLDNAFEAEEGNVWRRMLTPGYTYKVTVVVTTPSGTPDGELLIYIGEDDASPYSITTSGTYVIEKAAVGNALIFGATFTDQNDVPMSYKISSVLVESQNKPLVLTGTNKVIGSCDDVRNNAIVYMVQNSNDEHRFIRYYINDQRIQDIFPSVDTSVLEWTSESYIWNAKIIETGEDQLLFFLDDTTRLPRRINLSLWENRGSVYGYVLTEDDISVAKKQPQNEPTLSYGIDANQKSNFIRNLNFQFRYRWIYEDGEIGGLSPISEISIPENNNPDVNLISITVNSGGVQVVKVQLLKRIGNGSTQTGTTNPEWYIFNTIVKADEPWNDNTDYAVDFYNTESLLTVSRTDSDKNFELVPQGAGAQETVEGNQIVYGDITEGYGNIDTNITITPRYAATGDIKYTTSGNTINLSDAILPLIGDALFVIVDVGAGEAAYYGANIYPPLNNVDDLSDQIRAAITNNTGLSTSYNSGTKIITCAGATTIGSYTISDSGGYGFTCVDAISNATQTVNATNSDKILFQTINERAIPYSSSEFTIPVGVGNLSVVSISASLSVTSGLIGNPFVVYLVDAFTNILAVSSVFTAQGGLPITADILFGLPISSVIGRVLHLELYNQSGGSDIVIDQGATLNVAIAEIGSLGTGFKAGSSPSFGLVYFDQYMRQCGVQGSTDIYFTYPTERTWKNTYSEHESTKEDEGFIPQADWQIKHIPPDWAYYYKWVLRPDIETFVQLLIRDITHSGNNVKFKVTSLDTYPYLEFKDFAEGDRVRLLYTDTSLPFIDTAASVFDYIEVTVISFDEATSEFTCDNSRGYFNSSTIKDNDIVEIFLPSTNQLYFELSPTYNIGNPTDEGRYHEGPTQDQNPLDPINTPAEGPFDYGHVYFRFRNLQNAASTGARTILVESAAISDQYESSYWNKGRVQIETPNQTNQRLDMLRWGGKLFQNTQINNMSTFDEGNYVILNAKYNRVIGLREIGYTLKIIQEANYATSFIGRRQIQNADGSTQLVVTDSLIGSVNYSESGYGSKHKGSVVVSQRSMYFFDSIKGCMVRESGNQPTAISDYYMKRYWANQSLLAEAGDIRIVSEYDTRNDLLWVHQVGTNYSETLTFSELANRWKSFHDLCVVGDNIQAAEMLGAIGRTFVSFVDGYLWEHYAGTDWLQIYEEQKTMSVKSVFNLSPEQVKVGLTHSLHVNLAPVKTTFTTPPVAMYPSGMKSILKTGNYTLKEGVYYSEIKGDGYTTGVASEGSAQFKNGLVNGRPMRGHVIISEVEFETDGIVNLFSQECGLILSPKS